MSDADNSKDRRDETADDSNPNHMTGETGGAKKAGSRRVCWPITSAAPGAFDELLADDGEPRPHYAKLFGALEAVRRRRNCSAAADTCRRLVHEQGITYNVYGDPRGMERPVAAGPDSALSSRRTNGARSKPA